jgi:hypothetical protein
MFPKSCWIRASDELHYIDQAWNDPEMTELSRT